MNDLDFIIFDFGLTCSRDSHPSSSPAERRTSYAARSLWRAVLFAEQRIIPYDATLLSISSAPTTVVGGAGCSVDADAARCPCKQTVPTVMGLFQWTSQP